MKRLVFGFLCALALAISPACGGDDDGGDTTDGSGADAAGGGDAEAFCTGWGEACGFGDGFADQDACVAAFNGFDTARQACVDEHLGLAEASAEGSADRDMHCGHATGQAPCD